MWAPEECRPAAAAAAILSPGFMRTGTVARAFGLQIGDRGEGRRGGGGGGREGGEGPLLRYYMPSLQNIRVPGVGVTCLEF